MRTNLKLAPEKSVHEKMMDHIEAKWADWKGPTGNPWSPYDGPTEPWTGKVSASVDKATYRVNVSEELPFLRRLMRRIRRVK